MVNWHWHCQQARLAWQWHTLFDNDLHFADCDGEGHVDLDLAVRAATLAKYVVPIIVLLRHKSVFLRLSLHAAAAQRQRLATATQ